MRSGRVAFCTALAVIACSGWQSANAVTIVQKWHEGEKLSYDLMLNGSVTVDTDATAPFLWAGLPFEVEVHGDGGLNLETRAVNGDGTAVVACTVPRLKLAGSAFEQKAVLAIDEGKTAFSFNGRPSPARVFDGRFLVQPTYGLQIGANGRIQRLVPLETRDEGGGAATDAAGDDAPVVTAGGLPINVAGLLRAAVLQLLPAPWPDGEVAVGQSWSVVSRLPVPAARGTADAAGAVAPPLRMIELGKFTMTLKGTEQVAGRDALRVGVEGELTIDKDNAALVNQAVAGFAAGNQLVSAVQKVSGDLWFDADAGHLLQADLILKNQLKTVGATPAAANTAANAGAGNVAPAARTWKSTQGFYGNVKLTLHAAALAALPSPGAP